MEKTFRARRGRAGYRQSRSAASPKLAQFDASKCNALARRDKTGKNRRAEFCCALTEKQAPNWKSILCAFANQLIEKSRDISCIPSAQKVDSILCARRTIVGVLSISQFHFRLHRSILIALENTRTIVPDDWRNSSSLARCERTGVKMILAQQVSVIRRE